MDSANNVNLGPNLLGMLLRLPEDESPSFRCKYRFCDFFIKVPKCNREGHSLYKLKLLDVCGSGHIYIYIYTQVARLPRLIQSVKGWWAGLGWAGASLLE